MLKHLIAALSLAASTAAAQDIDLTDMLAAQGLAATEASLTGEDPGTKFALGATQFLRAIENSLQLRYRHNADFGDLDIPVLRLPLPANPDAAPFYPGIVTDIFRGVDADMATARASLAGARGEFGVVVNLAAIWFDINENGRQDQGESILHALSAAFGERPPEAAEVPDLTVRFDAADAAWLRAYTHLLAGVSNLVVAFDPTEVIAEVQGSAAQMQALRGDSEPRRLFFGDEETFADMFAMVYGAINQQPDPARTRAARDHMLAMVAENRAFWAAVPQETDNDREWIPNAGQTSALGFELPPQAGPTWMAVLSDAEKVLKGELLVGHWRSGPAAGVNVAKLIENPIPVDIVTWLHGHGLVPFMEKGPLVSPANMRLFDRMFRGDALFFMVLLN